MTESSQEGPGNWDENPFESDSAVALIRYLELMEDTESPRVYHIWSMLAAAAAAIGSGAKLQLGAFLTVKPNLFVVLVGPSAIKKSTPIDIAESLLAETTVRFGPTDSGGQRHGIMSALQGLFRRDYRDRQRSLDSALIPMSSWQRPGRDLALFSRELGRLWGSTNREMADFFLDLYDGADINYETKAANILIPKPTVTLLGATTPSSLASMLPDNAGDHGVLSRTMFVYSDMIHKAVAIPPDPTENWLDLREDVMKRFKWLDNNRMDFTLSPDAKVLYESLYVYKPKLDDPRLISYLGRRGQHLLKVAMCIAGLRGYTSIIRSDLRLAHELLAQIEPFMHKALESFGRNRAYQGRVIILQYLKSIPGNTASMDEVISIAAKEMTRRECEEVLIAMQTNNEVTVIGGRITLGSVKDARKKEKGGG